MHKQPAHLQLVSLTLVNHLSLVPLCLCLPLPSPLLPLLQPLLSSGGSTQLLELLGLQPGQQSSQYSLILQQQDGAGSASVAH